MNWIWSRDRKKERKAMANSSKRKGQSWETQLREGLRGEGFDIEALRLSGREDEGDMVVRVDHRLLHRSLPVRERVILEAKNVGTITLSQFVTEALVEKENYANHRSLAAERVGAVAVVKRRGKGWKEAYVVTTVREYFGLE